MPAISRRAALGVLGGTLAVTGASAQSGAILGRSEVYNNPLAEEFANLIMGARSEAANVHTSIKEFKVYFTNESVWGVWPSFVTNKFYRLAWHSYPDRAAMVRYFVDLPEKIKTIVVGDAKEVSGEGVSLFFVVPQLAEPL